MGMGTPRAEVVQSVERSVDLDFDIARAIDNDREIQSQHATKSLRNGLEAAKQDVQPHVDRDEDGGCKSRTPSKERKQDAPMVPFHRMFSFAEILDFVLMFFGALSAVIHGASLPFIVRFFGKLFNDVGLGTDPARLRADTERYSLYYLWLALAVFVTSWLEVALWMQTGERQCGKMRAAYFEAMLRQDVSYSDTETGSGAFVHNLITDSLLVQDALGEKMGTFIHYISTFVSGLVIGFSIEWRLAALTLANVPLIALVATFATASESNFSFKIVTANADAGNFAKQIIAEIRTVYSFQGERKAVKDYADLLQKTLPLGYKASLVRGLGSGGIMSVFFCSWALLFWYGAKLIRDGVVAGGDVLGAILTVLIAGVSLGIAIPNLATFRVGRAVVYKIFQLINRQPVINKWDTTAITPDNVQGRIDFRNVDFAYPARPDVPILEKLSLEIPPGKTLAIVGRSGSGKSTVISLIERFYDPIAGEILLDGHNLKHLSLTWLRGQIGLVNQELVLFATSIASNILYGKEGASQNEIEEVAKSANAHSFIDKLPLRYETQVGERGVQLSGGQKQRVAIARAMLKNPTVMLLDEATSALDTVSEKLVQEALDRLTAGRTTVIVAHRLSTIRNAHTIAVIQEGHIVEIGNHDTLIRKEDGAYSSLVRIQDLAATNDIDGAASLKTKSVSFRASSQPRPISRHRRSGSASRSIGAWLGSTSGRYHDQESLSFRAGSLSSRRTGSITSYRSLEEQESDLDPDGHITAPSKGAVMWLLAMCKDDWIYGLCGVFGSVLAGGINPALAILLGEVMDVILNQGFTEMKKQIMKFSLILVGVAAVIPCITAFQHYSLGVLGENLMKRIREEMFSSILQNEVGWFDQEDNNSNRMAAHLASNASGIRAAFVDRTAIILQNATTILLVIIISLNYQPKMAAVLLAVFPFLVLSGIGTVLFTKGLFGSRAKAYSHATQVAGEAMSNIRTILAFNVEAKVLDLFKKELVGPTMESFQKGKVIGLCFGLSQLLLFCSYSLAQFYFGKLISTGQGKLKEVMTVTFLYFMSAASIAEALQLTPDLSNMGQAMASVLEILAYKTAIDTEDPNGKMVEKIVGDIEFRKVAFAYLSRPDILIFQDLNLRVQSGHNLAIVGMSGSGKSSIVALLERFYDPICGHIMIDNLDIRKYHLKSLRGHISLVQQEPALFSATIYENIIYGMDGIISESEVIEATKSAYAHNFINGLPSGYQTKIGERGIKLSGGQRQRISIARAILKNCAILLLDEATSSLDSESEKVVLEALARIMQNRTTIIIAHRLSTIRGADSISVIQDGNILEQGSHSELLAKEGGYYHLVKTQSLATKIS